MIQMDVIMFVGLSLGIRARLLLPTLVCVPPSVEMVVELNLRSAMILTLTMEMGVTALAIKKWGGCV